MLTSQFKESTRRWKNYTSEQKQHILQDGQSVYTDMLAAMPHGANSPQVQAIVQRWHQHLRSFYEPTPQILLGLGQMYSQHPEFRATFDAMHPNLAVFMGVHPDHLLPKSCLIPPACGTLAANEYRICPL